MNKAAKDKLTTAQRELMGCRVHAMNFAETLAELESALIHRNPLHHGVINAGKVVAMHRDPALALSVLSSDLISADGAGIVLASRVLGKGIPERVAGIDLMYALLERAAKKDYKVFFLGAREEVLQTVLEKFRQSGGAQAIAGYRNGYFTSDQEAEIVTQIQGSGADILLVAMSSPLKEQFLARNRQAFANISLTMGVGGSFDVYAGKVRRAPGFWQRLGLEGFWRFVQEPRRMFRRVFWDNLHFLFLLFRYRLGWIPRGAPLQLVEAQAGFHAESP